MKTKLFSLFAAATMLTLVSCGTSAGLLSGTTTTGNGSTTTGDILSGLSGILGDLLGQKSLSESDLYGTWKYDGTDCVFESENVLLKAGGAAAAAKIEKEVDAQLSKIGINKGACSFTFNQAKSFTAVLGGRTVQGTYTYDKSSKKLKLTTGLGLASITGYAVRSGSGISLLFDSDKALKLISLAGTVSGSSSVKAITQVLSKYDGMQVGLHMIK